MQMERRWERKGMLPVLTMFRAAVKFCKAK
jgi:hypothetical protein